MSQYVVSARKYRPIRFSDVVGQEHVSNTLKNAIQTGHLAHAFLFCGPRGVGKTTCARILAKVLNCQQPTADLDPCDTCDSCKAFNEQASFNIVELDAASNNSVEHIRALIEQVRFQPQQGKYKIFIIDEVHMLSQQAFNAFLKTLEEPPPYAIFILATTEKHKIIPTILSRCQIFDFKRIQVPEIAAHLQFICEEENITAEPDALHIIAQKADGALRDALSIFDRMVSFSGDKITYSDVIENLNILDYDYFFKVVDALLTENASEVLLILDDVLKKGFDSDLFINGLAEHLRNLLVCQDPETLQLLEVGDALRQRYTEQAFLSSPAFLVTALQLANECDIHYKTARNKRLHVEMALIKMAYIQRAARVSPLAEEKKKPEPQPPGLEEEPAKSKPVQMPVAEVKQPPPPPPSKPATPKVLKSNELINSMLLEVNTEEDSLTDNKAIGLPEIEEGWQDFAAKCAKETVRRVMEDTQLDFAYPEVIATVNTNIAENTLRQELAIMDFLRGKLQNKELLLRIQVEKRPEDQAPVVARPLTDKEIFLKMAEANPALLDLQKRLDLRPDNS